MAINKNDLLQRVAAGVIYTLIMGVATLVSWWSTLVVIAVTSGICCYEFLRMATNEGFKPYKAIGTTIAVLMPLSMAINVDGTHVVAFALATAFIGGIVCLCRFFVRTEESIVDVSITIFGYLYVGLTLSSFILLRSRIGGGFEAGLMCLFVLLSVWMNDAFAYLGGSAFGKHKFASKISPKKTWEGVICGMFGSMLFWMLIPVVCPSCGFGFVWAAISGLLCGMLGIVGDLTESHIKRSFHTKDSGKLMPGHGGLLDRSDSLFFVSVVACFMIIVAPYAFNVIGVTL